MFNIRIYGIFLTPDNQQVLLADEFTRNMEMTKFPGGGLEYGEGPIECLQRECREELGLEISVCEHFYTTDYFQSSFFCPNTQLISIYYLAQFKKPELLKIASTPFAFQKRKEGALSIRYVPLSQLSEKDLTFPVDKKVATLLKKRFLKFPPI